jgi:hypothetical protein
MVATAVKPVLGPIIFLFGLLGGFGVPLGVPPLPETPLLYNIAPEECLVYMSSSGAAAPDAKSPNQTEQLLAEPEVQRLFAGIETLIKANLNRSLSPNEMPPGMSSDEMVDLVKLLLSKPMAVYVSDIRMGPGGPIFYGGAAIKFDEYGEKLKNIVELIAKTLPPQLFQKLEIRGFDEKYMLIAAGEGEMEALLKRTDGKAPQWLEKIRRDLPVERVSTINYLNVKTMRKIFVPMAGTQAAVIEEAIGIGNIDNIASVAGLDQNSYVSKKLISIDGEPKGLMQLATIKPLSLADLTPIPADASVALAAKINPLGVFDTFLETVEKAEPQGAARMRSDIARKEAQIGLKLREEILKPFGDSFTLYASPRELGIPNLISSIPLKDPPQAAKTYAKIIQMTRAASKSNLRATDAPEVTEGNFPGKYICTVVTYRYARVFCLTEKELIIANNPVDLGILGIEMPDLPVLFSSSSEELKNKNIKKASLMERSIQTYLSRPAGFKSLAESPEVEKIFTGEAQPMFFVYCDMQQIFDRIYPLLQLWAHTILHDQEINLNLSSQNAVRGHLTPLILTVRRTKSGIEITERTPLPGLGITQSAPIAAALLLPAVSSAPEAARRAASINNMKMIMLAMHNYLDANKRFPPAYRADKEGKPLLSWRVLILPMIEQGDLYDQFHLDEPWDSEHNKKLIAKMPPEYRSPNSRAGEGKTNYLAVRGEKTMFPGKQGIRIAEVTDGMSHTIAIVEAADDKAVIWTKPDDFEYDNEKPLKGLTGLHPSVFLAAFADGSVRAISITIDPKILKGMFTRNGGETVPKDF